MIDTASISVAEAEAQIALLFERTGHEIEEKVGHEPDSVVHLARPHRGLVKPYTYWEVWRDCPESPDAALADLEKRRVRHGADLALGILIGAPLPAGHVTDIKAHRVDIITWRTLAFELTGVAEEIRELAHTPATAPEHPDNFLPRQLETPDGRVVDAVTYIEDWIQRDEDNALRIVGPALSGTKTLLRHIALRAARAYLANPEHMTPIITTDKMELVQRKRGIIPEFQRGWCVWILGATLQRVGLGLDYTPIRRPHVSQARLLELLPARVLAWYRDQLPAALYQKFSQTYERNADLAALADSLPFLSMLATAIMRSEPSDPPAVWLADVIVRFMHLVLAEEEIDDKEHTILEIGALEEFAMGASHLLARDLDVIESRVVVSWLSRGDPLRSHFSNRLIRDYFIACKIASEVRAGRPGILTRYIFPKEYVLLFLAVLAPDVAAQLTADRSADMRAQIRSDVEHQVQLTLAHQLRRSAGALRSNLGRVRQRMDRHPDMATSCARELERIDQELDFLSAMAEHTRKWHEVPEAERHDLVLAAMVHQVLDPLRERYPGVEVVDRVSTTIEVSASERHLRESLHGLLENAFQAVTSRGGPDQPYVLVKAEYRPLGKTVRIDIIDNGPGVAEDDRARIFEPRVTTKKGGHGAPLGTGMGLPIARRYAEAMGGRLSLDTDAEETCFYIELIAGKRNHE